MKIIVLQSDNKTLNLRLIWILLYWENPAFGILTDIRVLEKKTNQGEQHEVPTSVL